MAEHRAPTIAEARAAATARRKATEARKAAEKAAADKPAAAAPKTESLSLLDRIRAAFSSEDDINRIDSAVDAVTAGVEEADKDNKK